MVRNDPDQHPDDEANYPKQVTWDDICVCGFTRTDHEDGVPQSCDTFETPEEWERRTGEYGQRRRL